MEKNAGYHIRSLVETAMLRFKTIFGDKLSAITLEFQIVEVIEKCSMLNILTSHGIPVSIML